MKIAPVVLCGTLVGLLAGPARAAELPMEETFTNSLGMRFVRVEPGRLAFSGRSERGKASQK